MIEYRVAVVRAGIPSFDYYTDEDKAIKRGIKLRKQYPSDVRISVQTREVSEWSDVSSR